MLLSEMSCRAPLTRRAEVDWAGHMKSGSRRFSWLWGTGINDLVAQHNGQGLGGQYSRTGLLHRPRPNLPTIVRRTRTTSLIADRAMSEIGHRGGNRRRSALPAHHGGDLMNARVMEFYPNSFRCFTSNM